MQKKSLEHQIYLSQIFGIVLAILLSLGISLRYNLVTKQKSLDRNITNTGILLSESPDVIHMLKKGCPSLEFNQYLDDLMKKLDYIDIVTICDSRSIRFYHTNKALIGMTFVGGDQKAILNGANPYITNGNGTLGKQRRAFFPVKDENNHIVGFVMVSVLTTSIFRLTKNIVEVFIILAVLLIAIGVFTSHMLYKRLRKILFGYRPEDFRKIHIERNEILNALEEGIFAINSKEELILMNESARRILDLEKTPKYGTKVTEIYPETRLPNILHSSVPEYNISLTICGKHILSNRIPIIEQDKTIGAVTILRNRTEVTKMAEELTGARYMVETLRAYSHEFKNKLHVILGYIEMGEPEKVSDFIVNTEMVSNQAVSEVSKKIHVSGIAALMIGKIIRATELGITLTLKPDSSCIEEQTNLPTNLYITILGNLIENSLEELNQENIKVKEIQVGIYIWKTGSILSIDDTGKGIPIDIQDKIFEKDFSTKGKTRGSGMYLIKELVDRYHGTLELESEENVGTSFIITFSKEQQHV